MRPAFHYCFFFSSVCVCVLLFVCLSSSCNVSTLNALETSTNVSLNRRVAAKVIYSIIIKIKNKLNCTNRQTTKKPIEFRNLHSIGFQKRLNNALYFLCVCVCAVSHFLANLHIDHNLK